MMQRASLFFACSLWVVSLPGIATATQACSDPCLKAAIASLYMRSPFLSPFEIAISVHDATVTLEGVVADANERDLAVEIARSIEGIREVVDYLEIDPDSRAEPAGAVPACDADDAPLAERVRSQLYWNRNTHGLSLQVTASNGVVTLQGEVASRSEAALARLIALNTCGVSQVNSRFRVLPEE